MTDLTPEQVADVWIAHDGGPLMQKMRSRAVRGVLSLFTPEKPMIVPPSLYQSLKNDPMMKDMMDRVTENRPIAATGATPMTNEQLAALEAACRDAPNRREACRAEDAFTAAIVNAYRAGQLVVRTEPSEVDVDRVEDSSEAAAYREYSKKLEWLQGNRNLPTRYLGWHIADAATDMILRAYPELARAAIAAMVR